MWRAFFIVEGLFLIPQIRGEPLFYSTNLWRASGAHFFILEGLFLNIHKCWGDVQTRSNRHTPNSSIRPFCDWCCGSMVVACMVSLVWNKLLQRTPRRRRRKAKEIEKASNKCLPDAVLTASAKVQAPGKGVNDAGSKALKQM